MQVLGIPDTCWYRICIPSRMSCSVESKPKPGLLLEPTYGYGISSPRRPNFRQILVEWIDAVSFWKDPSRRLPAFYAAYHLATLAAFIWLLFVSFHSVLLVLGVTTLIAMVFNTVWSHRSAPIGLSSFVPCGLLGSSSGLTRCAFEKKATWSRTACTTPNLTASATVRAPPRLVGKLPRDRIAAENEPEHQPARLRAALQKPGPYRIRKKFLSGLPTPWFCGKPLALSGPSGGCQPVLDSFGLPHCGGYRDTRVVFGRFFLFIPRSRF